jgi:hypothetical protein
MTSRTVYVPVYSSIYWGVDIKQHMVALAVTVSLRNVTTQLLQSSSQLVTTIPEANWSANVIALSELAL